MAHGARSTRLPPAVMPVAEKPGNTLIFNQIHLE
jgi:hypothetical protein